MPRPGTLWKLNKALYRLVRSPLHWFENVSNFLKLIGLQSSPNIPCVFVGNLLPNHLLLFVGLYVDDFCYFSTSDPDKQALKAHLNNQYSVSYDDKLDWFLRMKFERKESTDDLKCLCHQEMFLLYIMIERYNLAACNKSPRAVRFKWGLPVDTISLSTLPTDQQTTIAKQFQQIIGDLNLLSISTHIDTTSIYLILKT